MKKQQISFKSDNLNLYGEIHFPETIDKSKPVLCLCHGIPAVTYNPEEQGYAVLAEKFCSNGFITFIFNFRGAGPSQGNLDLLGWTHDLQAAIDLLYSLDEVNKSKLVLIGSSGGAAVSVFIAARDSRVSSVVTLACPANFDFLSQNQAEQLIAHFRSIGAIRDKNFPPSINRWLESFNTVSPLRDIPKISPRPLLLIHGDKDDIVPVEHAYQLYKQAKEPKELIIIPGAGHRLRLEEKAVGTVLDWLKSKQILVIWGSF
jgi:dipeptidyl aminopeptidase/acylaminoacyl peptidase